MFSTEGVLAVTAALILGSTLAPPAAAQQTEGNYGRQCSGSVDRNSPRLTSGFGFDLSNTRHQESRIDSSNVAGLGVAYSHVAVGAQGKRGAPAATDQAMFFSAGRDIVAMDRHTGCIFWKYTVPASDLGITLGKNIVRSSSILLIDDDPSRPALVAAGDAQGRVYAVDAVTGQLAWSAFAGANPQYDWITGGLQYFDGKLFVPVSSREVITTAADPATPCCTTHGVLQVFDAYTGAVTWTYHTTPPAQELSPTPLGGRALGPNGASLWGVPAIDPASRTVYIGTGQNYSPPLTDTSDAIIALDLDTGSRRWAFQARKDDIWNAACEVPALGQLKCADPIGHDFDFGAPPILTRLPDGRRVVLAGDKGGDIYCIDAGNGSLIWRNELGRGSALGGVHMGMATDGKRLYVPIADAFADKTSALTKDLPSLLGPNGPQVPVQPVPEGRPGIYALDIATGSVVWDIHPTHIYDGAEYISIYSAAPSVTNDVLLAGSLDGELRAFRTADGTELARFDSDIDVVDVAGNTGAGGTIDSVGAVPVDDTILLNSGYSNFGGIDAYQAGPGNVLFVLKVPAR
ncbi:PQQ-binding-like beta-propeller repeat protein [Skermania piniformis]|uniref:PQQ-binding-like beta-propeller repeat protein n=1 Tax=Skermania pinensis TaxID=39122 RepID=A0ABX8S7M2_9ACTN|nr:PQQ-binding-like beta-propeller repeat protein [Skermania piniformis]QXQ13753.1 PQQ-binding-like beta-propeller repeat protein [Skermania piniformis]